uniref:Uncharacterized protein n=1 Tax=Suricata suricatta TaxID=37032 RepID=A0A673TUK6_SURSU
MLNSSLAVLTNPYVIPQAPTQTPAFLKETLLAPFPSSSFPPTAVWVNVCVDVITLGWKGLASHDAKKQNKKKPHQLKTSFLLLAHALATKDVGPLTMTDFKFDFWLIERKLLFF